MKKYYYLNNKNQYRIEKYNQLRPFASFLPGISGKYGMPLWVFYVNRGQCISSFGIQNKESPIMEFHPANQAYRIVSTIGFRTFVKIKTKKKYFYFEPFGAFNDNKSNNSKMYIGLNDLEIETEEHGLNLKVLYYILPQEEFAGLIRRLTITNVSKNKLEGEVIDGTPVIIPFGISNFHLKSMSNTAIAWMNVDNLDKNIPFYKISSSIEDSTIVKEYESGHFYLCFTNNSLLKPIIDPDLLFGPDTSLSYPEGFITHSLQTLYAKEQISQSKTPCCFFGTTFLLKPGETISLCSMIGHVQNKEYINQYAPKLAKISYIEKKHSESKKLTLELTDCVAIKTSSASFNAYCRQNLLDNMLRGGYPEIIKTDTGEIVYYVYSRRHGDLERDYNSFFIPLEFYSSGFGNYRDIIQNRRCDVFIQPKVEDTIISDFINLIQTDGYNPLIINGLEFILKNEEYNSVLSYFSNQEKVKHFFKKPFTPGFLIKYLKNNKINTSISLQQLFSIILSYSNIQVSADFNDGYWIDHWTYILDLIENYLAIYPDKEEYLLFDKNDFIYFDSAAIVLPRKEKYVKNKQGVRQIDSVFIDKIKLEQIRTREEYPNVMRDRNGKGKIYKTNLLEKLFCIFILKFSSMDPFGFGIEMEADKPGWNDALNGLPGIFGSSVAETCELLRLGLFLITIINKYQHRNSILLAGEIWKLSKSINNEIENLKNHGNHFNYWDKVSSLRELYRKKTRYGFTGHKKDVDSSKILLFLNQCNRKILKGLKKTQEYCNNSIPTFFIAHPERYKYQMNRDEEKVKILEFSCCSLPEFLEGYVKYIKIAESLSAVQKIYNEIKQGPLYDQKLCMYKNNASLKELPKDIGRVRAFTPGWLENESIWIHMTYKYLLELLKAGLYPEFWHEAKTNLIPFLNSDVYGRSILENCSFIVSSAHPDSSLHGRGFFARLSGSTAEFLNMWIIITSGKNPFVFTKKGLELNLSPALPGWLFCDDGTLSFTFLGNTEVTYHNPEKKDIFPGNSMIKTVTKLRDYDGTEILLKDPVIGSPLAAKIREGKIKSITIHYEEQK